jgi:hypothetical protein
MIFNFYERGYVLREEALSFIFIFMNGYVWRL